MKSNEVKFNEALDALKKAGKTKLFEAKLKPIKEKLGLVPVETQLKLAEEVLKEAGVVRANESGPISRLTHEQYQVFSKRLGKKPTMSVEEQATLAEAIMRGEIKESITKNNGAAENFVENNPFGRTAQEFSPGYIKEVANPCAKGDKIMADGLLKLGKITEAEHRKLTGNNKPEGYEKLNEQQRKDFDFARLVGISESDAFKLVKITGTNFKEVSRR